MDNLIRFAATRTLRSTSAIVCAPLLMLAVVDAQQAQPTASRTLAAQDRTEIQELVAHYGRALASCAPEEWADLFASPGGVFGSGSRGQVSGRDKLIALVRSEPACVRPAANAAPANRRPAAGPEVVLKPSPEGATGKLAFGNGGGYYEDVYVKTPKGWRFKSRNVLSAQEAAAKLSVQDFKEIRRLAGDDRDQFDDVYLDTPSAAHSDATPGGGPGRIFRASGLVITASPEGVKGKGYLRNDGGSYDDVYVKTTTGWRFQSRVYVAR